MKFRFRSVATFSSNSRKPPRLRNKIKAWPEEEVTGTVRALRGAGCNATRTRSGSPEDACRDRSDTHRRARASRATRTPRWCSCGRLRSRRRAPRGGCDGACSPSVAERVVVPHSSVKMVGPGNTRSVSAATASRAFTFGTVSATTLPPRCTMPTRASCAFVRPGRPSRVTRATARRCRFRPFRPASGPTVRHPAPSASLRIRWAIRHAVL